MNRNDLMKRYADHIGDRSPQYVGIVQKFLNYADDLDRENVEAFLKQLERRGYRSGSRNHYFSVLRTFFRVSGMEWPFHKGEAPHITEQDEHRPGLSLRVVTLMVGAARAGKLIPDCVPFLALATTYGLRRVEIISVNPDDVRGNLIFIHTKKGGRQRWHQIPPEIHPIILQYDWSRRYSLERMSQMFWDVVNGTDGLEALKQVRVGWHAFRRSLLTGLENNGCGTLVAKRFLRWGSSPSGDDAMPLRYYANTELDVDGEQVVSKEAESDAVIFKKYHPYIKLWSK